MACPNCDHTMQQLTDLAPIFWKHTEGADLRIFWCPRCGTIKDNNGIATPKLIPSVVALLGLYDESELVSVAARQLGIVESVTLPGQQ